MQLRPNLIRNPTVKFDFWNRAMTQHSKENFGMDVKGEVLLQLFNKAR